MGVSLRIGMLDMPYAYWVETRTKSSFPAHVLVPIP